MLTKQRFIDRIGKRVYRNKLTCICRDCHEIEKNWLVIHDEMHANVLYNVYCDYNCAGTIIEYTDEKHLQKDRE